jgi:hypothetical protein
MVKLICFNEGPSPGNIDGEVIRMTEQEVLDYYWDHWHKLMLERYPVTSPEISVENFIEDFMIVHWAWWENHED